MIRVITYGSQAIAVLLGAASAYSMGVDIANSRWPAAAAMWLCLVVNSLCFVIQAKIRNDQLAIQKWLDDIRRERSR
jgi:hypothetical protein